VRSLLIVLVLCGEAAAGPTDFVELLTAKKAPALVGPFAKLKLSPMLTIAQARTQAPELVDEKSIGKSLDWFEYKGADITGAVLRVRRVGQIDSGPDTWLVGELRAVIKDPKLEDKLIAAWGAPRKTKKTATWLDPAAKIRCVLFAGSDFERAPGAMVLDCGGYLPLADLIGTDKKLFGFEEGKPLIGMTQPALQKRYGRRLWDEGTRIKLWPTETSTTDTTIQFGSFDAPTKVTYFRITMIDAKAAAPLLEAKFGKPKETDAGQVYRAKAPKVTLDGNEIIVGVVPEDDL
jgi:hypothetical protein